jgi:alpha-tubulin suppressor-like RCC1 family protein
MRPLRDIVTIHGDFNTGAALRSDGTVWTWGSNEGGRLGRTGSNVLAGQVPMPGDLKIRDLRVTRTGAALTTRDTVVTWGAWVVDGDPYPHAMRSNPTERPEFGEIKGLAGADPFLAIVDKSGRIGLVGSTFGHPTETFYAKPYWLPGALLRD